MSGYEEIEARYKALFQQSRDYILILEPSPHGPPVIVDASDSAFAAHGYTRDELIGKPITFLDPGLSASELSDRMALLDAGGVLTFEVQHERKDGSSFFAEVRIQQVEIGGRTFLHSIERDVTEKKKRAEELRQYEQIVSSTTDLMALVSDKYIYLGVNGAYLRALGKTREEVVGRSVAEVAGERTFIESVKPNAERCMAGSVVNYSLWYEFPNIGHRYMDIYYYPYLGENRQVKGFVMSTRDETKRKLAEEALRLQGQITTNMAEGVNIVNLDGTIFYTNPKFDQMFGYAPGELLGKHVSVLNAPADKDPDEIAREIFAAISEHGEWKGEVKNKRKDGTEFWCSYTISTFFHHEHGKVLVTVQNDITESKRIQDALRQAHSSLEQRVKERTGELEEASNKLQLVMNSLPEHIFWKDRNSVYMGCNDSFAQITGFGTPENIVGKTDLDMPWTREEALSFREHDSRIMQTDTPQYGIVEPYHQAGGALRWVLTNKVPLRDSSGMVTGILGTIQDISERKEAEERLKIAATVFESAMEGVMVTGADRSIQYVNPSFTRITGFSAEEAIGNTPKILRSGRHSKAFYEAMWKELVENGKWQGEIWNRRKDGQPYLVRQNITARRDAEGVTTQYVSVFHDITLLKQSEEEIKYQAYHDLLTGLPNRSLFNDRLKQSIARASRDRHRLAVLFIDIDNFKRVNDNFGHFVGDLLIQGVGMRLTACVRETDSVSRYAGDEFAIIMENVKDDQSVSSVATKINEALAEPYVFQGKNIESTVSIGVAIYPADGNTGEELIKNADLAMYHVKDQTKNSFSFFTQVMNEQATRRYDLESRMREALVNDEFVVYYQPKVSMATGKITSMEALVRWNPPDGSMIFPDEFIPLAESTGLIVPIGERVLLGACEQLKTWHDKGYTALKVSVNISPRQLETPNFLSVVKTTLAVADINPSSLLLEVTETGLMRDLDLALATLDELKKLGVKISMDDFGTGYSSLSHLRQFPIEELKIDKQFIKNISSNSDDTAIVTAIISMARSLNLRVVAEGVETEVQRQFLRDAGCDETQGYMYSRPIPAEEMEALLEKSENSNPEQ